MEKTISAIECFSAAFEIPSILSPIMPLKNGSKKKKTIEDKKSKFGIFDNQIRLFHKKKHIYQHDDHNIDDKLNDIQHSIHENNNSLTFSYDSYENDDDEKATPLLFCDIKCTEETSKKLSSSNCDHSFFLHDEDNHHILRKQSMHFCHKFYERIFKFLEDNDLKLMEHEDIREYNFKYTKLIQSNNNSPISRLNHNHIDSPDKKDLNNSVDSNKFLIINTPNNSKFNNNSGYSSFNRDVTLDLNNSTLKKRREIKLSLSINTDDENNINSPRKQVHKSKFYKEKFKSSNNDDEKKENIEILEYQSDLISDIIDQSIY